MNNAFPGDDRDLVRRVADGDQEAFALIFHRYSDKLAAFLFTLTGNREDVKEIVQEVFLKLWQRRSSLETVDDLDGYIFIVSRNAALDLLRKNLSERKARESTADQASADPGPEAASRFKKLVQLHTAAIRQLPPQQQKVYVLSREEGLTHREIADLTGISAETVKKHIMAAARFVRAFVSEHYEVLLFAFMFCH